MSKQISTFVSHISLRFNSVANTLFIQIHCPVVRPEMIVISDYGQTTINFGSASIGQQISRTVLIQNISNKPIQVSYNQSIEYLY